MKFCFVRKISHLGEWMGEKKVKNSVGLCMCFFFITIATVCYVIILFLGLLMLYVESNAYQHAPLRQIILLQQIRMIKKYDSNWYSCYCVVYEVLHIVCFGSLFYLAAIEPAPRNSVPTCYHARANRFLCTNFWTFL